MKQTCTMDEFKHSRILSTPCCACGKTLIEYSSYMIYCFNSHIENEDYHIHPLSKYHDGKPIYKCHQCKTNSKRQNIKRHWAHLPDYSGYHTEPNCSEKECKNWDHYTSRE